MQALSLTLGRAALARTTVHARQSARMVASAAAVDATPAHPPPKMFASHNLYKGKAAMQATPIAPTIAPSAQGNFYVSKPGGFLLEFANATAPRTYDWQARLAGREAGS